MDLVDALAAVARFGLLPRLCDLVSEALRRAVERSCQLPVAAIGGQAGQAEAGVGEAGTVPVPAAYPQDRLERGPRTLGVVFLAQYPALVHDHVAVLLPGRLHGFHRLVHVSPGGGGVPGAQCVYGGVVVQPVAPAPVTGPFGSRDGLDEQLPGV